jgi:purine-binding chemotaxis protein CheW
MLREELQQEGEQVSVIVFEVGSEQFAVDLLDVKEIIQSGQIRRLPKSFDYIEGIYNYRGNIIHIINLKRKLRLDDYRIYTSDNSAMDLDSSKNFIIIMNINNNQIGFFVDRITQVAHINYNQLEELSPIFQTGLNDISYVRGIIKFKDRPRVFIDLRKVLSEEEKSKIIKDQASII